MRITITIDKETYKWMVSESKKRTAITSISQIVREALETQRGFIDLKLSLNRTKE
jgi:predicted CopG family antitoxin